MKLSAAIMLGSTLRPQCRMVLFQNGGSCAFGAAAEAIGKTEKTLNIVGEWPWLNDSLKCPDCGQTEKYGAAVISNHLNDAHRWTRESIAEWVATVEPKEESGSEIRREQGISDFAHDSFVNR